MLRFGGGGADGIAERHESLHSVVVVRPEKLVREGWRQQAGRQFSQAGMPPSPSLPLVAIVILIRHSNNDSLAANWSADQERERGREGERSGAGG